VRRYRFDDEVSIPITRFGSRFRIGPLTGADSRVRVEIIRLPPGGLVGRHEAVAQQLFAVVTGHGWVSGGDGRRAAIGPGQAALWDPGEEHDASSEGGLTAVCVEGEFDVWALGVTVDIVVSDYDPAWPEWFDALHRRIWPAVEDVALRIDHVGSTSVPGLAAKPIIDMDIVVAGGDDVRPVVDRLRSIGYRWRGDLGVTGREAFRPPGDEELPAHHLYLVVENNRAHLDHWLLRDRLRQDADARDRYAALKRRNVELADRDMDVYVAAKAGLVAELLTEAREAGGWPPVDYWEPDLDPP
jgi:GrpB-like predicted nucleotidyltransferase (UPF0157 family)/mannose-6-phosphate isomerase-like protein (cupin superfamily)